MAMFEGVFKIDKFLTIMNEKGGSDLFLTTGLEPSMKLNGRIVKIDQYPGYGNGFDEGMFLRSS